MASESSSFKLPHLSTYRRQDLVHWNAAQAMLDERRGTHVPYQNLSDLLVDQLEDATPLPTVLCLLIVDLMDAKHFVPLPRGGIKHLPPERLDDGQRGWQIRFIGGGTLLLPRSTRQAAAEFNSWSWSSTPLAVAAAGQARPTIKAACCSTPAARQASRAAVGVRFLFFRQCRYSIELFPQSGIVVRLHLSQLHPHNSDASSSRAQEPRPRGSASDSDSQLLNLNLPVAELTQSLGAGVPIGVFYAPAGQCEHRIKACRGAVDLMCDNACCSREHCVTYSKSCQHHD